MNHAPAKALEFAPRAAKSRLHERQHLIDLFTQLAAADMTAAAYRIAADMLARQLQHGRHTEAVPVTWMAERLGLHRNAIGAGYKQLEEAGLCLRIANRRRGAPTRTSLVGPARQLVALTVASQGAALNSTNRESGDSILTNSVAPALVRARIDSTESPHPITTGSLPDGESTDSSCTAHNQDTHRLSQHGPGSGPDASKEVREGRNVGQKPVANRDSRLPHEYPPEVREAVLKKLPGWEMSRAMNGKLSEGDIKAEWNLIPEERGYLMSYAKRVEPPPKAVRKHEIASVPTTTPPAVAKRVWESYPCLVQLTDAARAGHLLDEIAYSVTRGMLGNGDQARGVRAALSLVRKGSWSTPRGFTADWRGAVARSLHAGTTNAA